MSEDYVSFETAKLLKEKGFNETCYACYEYFSSSITMYSGWPFEYKGEPVHNSKDIIICPTLQMAMKWLREVYNIIITIHPNSFNADGSVYYKADIWFNREYVSSYDIEEREKKVYEESVEDAIKYCLENLI